MTFVVTNNKVFKEFNTLKGAVAFLEKSNEFGLRIAERDAFGNLADVDESAVAEVREEVKAQIMAAQEAEEIEGVVSPPKTIPAATGTAAVGVTGTAPGQPVPQTGAAASTAVPASTKPVPEKQEEKTPVDKPTLFIKLGALAVIGTILVVVFLRIVLPIIIDFMRTWRSIP
ncbi:MAG: hypothetical protein ABIC95_06375 [archaeon]